MNYEAKKTFGGYGVFDSDGNQVGETYNGTGAKAQAEEEAARLNAEADNEFVRGKGREGRSG